MGSPQPPLAAVPTIGSPTPGSTSPSPERKRPKRVLPTNRITFPKQPQILRAWATLSGPSGKVVTNAQVGAVMKMAADTVSLANPFFADIGLLEKVDGGYVPGPATIEFNNAYEWDPEKAAHRLAPVLSAAWFGEALLPRLHLNPMTETEAVTVLAELAGVGPAHKANLIVCLEYLALAGLIEREGGQVRRVSSHAGTASPAPVSPPVEERREQARSVGFGGTAVNTSFAQQGSPEGQIQFNISVRVSMAEVSGWQADRIAAFFNGIAAVLAAKGGVEQGAANQ
jgi:hypothetical protein